MRSDHVLCLSPSGFHRMQYVDWGDPHNQRVVVCVHGLSRNCRDFDFLAADLARDFRVVCPDIVGRGRSDWLANKMDYSYPQYMADLTALLARIGTGGDESSRTIYWVGTSMGGLLGMLLASLPNSPIARLVVNDVGPFIPKSALERIAAYLGKDPRFATLSEMENYVRQVSATFGPHSDEQWRHLSVHVAKQFEDGSWGMRYDPGIAAPFRQSAPQDVDLWQHWDRVSCDTLVLRGANSDLLLDQTLTEMRRRGPRPRVVEFPGVGHAPTLMQDEQISVVSEFLRAT